MFSSWELRAHMGTWRGNERGPQEGVGEEGTGTDVVVERQEMKLE